MGIEGLDQLIEEDGFTEPFIADTSSGTYMSLNSCVVLRMTHDQEERFSNMSDSERNEYARKHGKEIK